MKFTQPSLYLSLALGGSAIVFATISAAPPARPLIALPASVSTLNSAQPSATPSPTIATATSARSQVQVTHCLVSLIEDIQVPAKEAGALTQVTASEGDYVRAGQLLATIDDRQAQLQKQASIQERDAALAKASDDIEVRYATAAFEVAGAELDRALAVQAKNSGAVAIQDIQKLRLAKHRDELQIDRSKLEMKIARMGAEVKQATVELADEALARRQIVSPIDGLIVSLFHERGEWVNSGEPVLQIVRIDRLRVEGFISAAEVGPEMVSGQPVVVEVALAGGRVAQLPGTVTFVNPLVQAGNKYRVRAEVNNQAELGTPVLRPGMTATMTIAAGGAP
jgi:multidrug efflux pump subunit AcrA (membrane-fusion protein)